jgi:hypothetical protein
MVSRLGEVVLDGFEFEMLVLVIEKGVVSSQAAAETAETDRF